MKKWGYMLVGAIGISLIVGGTAGFAKSITKKISVRFSNIELIVNGQAIDTMAEPFIYNGNVYAPIATIANMLGIHQEWDNRVPAVRISNSPIGPGEHFGIEKPMGNGIYLLTNLEKTGQYALGDQQKRIDIPLSGNTVITEVTSFLYLTGEGYPHDFLVIEKQKDNQSIVYLSVYNYHQGKLTKVTSVNYTGTHPDHFVHVAHEKGLVVFFSEEQDHQINSTQVYEWDLNTKTYVKAGELASQTRLP